MCVLDVDRIVASSDPDGVGGDHIEPGQVHKVDAGSTYQNAMVHGTYLYLAPVMLSCHVFRWKIIAM